MKHIPVIIVSALVTLLATPVFAQRDVNTSSARAAYDVPSFYSERKVKKVKQKPEKESRKTRKIKKKNIDSARARRRSLHF